MYAKKLVGMYRKRYKDTGEVDVEKVLDSLEIVLTLSHHVVSSYKTSEENTSIQMLAKALSQLGVFDE